MLRCPFFSALSNKNQRVFKEERSDSQRQPLKPSGKRHDGTWRKRPSTRPPPCSLFTKPPRRHGNANAESTRGGEGAPHQVPTSPWHKQNDPRGTFSSRKRRIPVFDYASLTDRCCPWEEPHGNKPQPCQRARTDPRPAPGHPASAATPAGRALRPCPAPLPSSR